MDKPTIFIRLTAPGRGAVAVVRVEGDKALQIVETAFSANNGKKIGDLPINHIVLGRFGGSDGDEVVLRHRDDEAFEIHCHGGWAAVALIEKTLAAAGAIPTTWQSWAANRSDAPTTAAALLALAEAQTERTAAVLLDQLNGALQREIDAIKDAASRGDLATAHRMRESLLARVEFGRHLTRPWRIVLAGRPNVGKSSLLNAMAGCVRAIVHHTPGTTRDIVSYFTAIEGLPVEICDTAGLRVAVDSIEKAGVALAEHHASEADLVLLVTDLSAPWSDEERKLSADWPDALYVHNKSDASVALDSRPTGVCVSALRGDGIAELLATIARRLLPNPPPTGAGVPINEEQVELIRRSI